jgi:tRNA/tmRNA/rRNA uracil-C5-methylase (TrmA/RlmC/RlmD family)
MSESILLNNSFIVAAPTHTNAILTISDGCRENGPIFTQFADPNFVTANARLNRIGNIRFFCRDATEFLVDMAARGEKMDVLFMDPPRSGSTEAFIRAAASMGPERIVYISCNPVTMARDMKVFRGLHYQAKEAWPVDMFPWTKEIEVAALLTRK